VRIASALATARVGLEVRAIEAAQRTALYRHFMQAPFPVAVFRGPHHVIELANPGTLAAWGKDAGVVGKPLAEAVPELRDQPFLGYLDRVFRTGVAYEGQEEVARLPAGPGGAVEESYFNFVYAPLRDSAGAIEGVLLSAFVVTDQVRARQELEGALTRAEKLAVELSQAMDERSRAVEAAEMANRSKDVFLANLSHELRTPLNAIVGWSNLLCTGAVEAPQVPKALETIERNARIQSRLIEDMLDLARIEQGKLVLSVGPTEVVRVVEAAIDAVRPAAEARGVRLQPILDSHATIVGDPDRLQQVVWNLLSNAIKFTPRGGRVQVSLQRAPSYVELVVADDGQGIVPDFLPHVFDRFRQADGKITRKASGLGLGLAIVRAIVELHGGTVTAQSDGVNRGATFKVRLPLAPLRAASAPPGTRAPAPAPPTLERHPALAGLRVLVVDDEAETRELLRYVLARCDAQANVAASAAEALTCLSGSAVPDVLVSDIGMPETDGYTFIRQVRAIPGQVGRVPAIALTAYASSEDRTLALRAGFDMHLTKPVQPNELLVVIATLVDSVRRRFVEPA
jgi:signal transduction histidine kinase/ActR/RegA family two-component response regulator